MKFVSRLMLAVVVLLVCVSPAFEVQALAQAGSGEKGDARIFTYLLKMENVDTSDDARPYPSDTRQGSLIGFNGLFTATKRLPYKVGPGKVRVYMHAFPEGDDKELSVTIAGQKQTAIYSRKTARYSWHELVFDLKKPEDMLEFEARSVDGEKARVIWYSTLITNDPAMHYVEVSKGKFKVRRQDASYANPAGNLIPNSGFEEGIQGWDVTNYKSNIMIKPSLLSKKAAHYQLGMDVGKITVTSRWFPLEKNQTYNLSYYVATDNAVPVEAVLETQPAGSGLRKVLGMSSAEAAETSLAGWKRASITFTAPADTDENENAEADDSSSGAAGMYRLKLHATGSSTPVIVDSVQITQGESLLPYSLNQGLEANIISPSTQAIYLLNAPGNMYFNLASDKDVTVQKVTAEVTDYFDREVVAPKVLNISNAGQVPVSLPTDRAGVFRVRTHIAFTQAGASHTLTREFFYNVVYPSAPRTDRLAWSQLGGYFTNAPKGPFSYAEVANRFGIYEFNTLGHQMGRWKANMARDPQDRSKYLRKQYDFSSSEKEHAQFAKNKINTIVNFHVNGTSGSYGVPFGLNPESGPVFEFKKNIRFAQEDWLHFVTAYVTHFKGRVKRYEVQDEPYQYFTAENYAPFYLATYKAIKKADPNAMVFIHNAHGKMDYIDALDKLTDNKAHEHMDGVYLYLTQQHSGKVSRTAVPEFRAWAKKHNLPIFTATCFSQGKDFSKHSLDKAPDYLSEREDEVRAIQHFFDSLIWGQAQVFYYYYGSHPGGSYASLFDNYGQIIPLVHFYSTANALVGDHTNVISIDDFDPLRIGVVETQRNKTYAILYSADGKLHDLTVEADTFVQALDGFGNPTNLEKTNGKVRLVVGPQPVYLVVNNAAAAVDALKAGSLTELFDVEFTYQRPTDGGLEMRALITSSHPLNGWTDTHNVYRRELTDVARTKQLAEQLYELRIPLSVSPVNTLNNSYYLKMSSNLGDHYASYDNTYAPLLEGTPVVDGKHAANEWPLHESQTIPLGGYYLSKDKVDKKAYTRGQAALTHDTQNLYGLVTLYKGQTGHTVTLEIAPRDTRTGLPQEDKITRIVVSSKSISIDGREVSGTQAVGANLKDAADVKRLRATDLIEFSIPLAALPGMKMSDGETYALRIKANDPKLADETKMPSWYLDATWPALNDVNAADEPARWGTLMVVR